MYVLGLYVCDRRSCVRNLCWRLCRMCCCCCVDLGIGTHGLLEDDQPCIFHQFCYTICVVRNVSCISRVPFSRKVLDIAWLAVTGNNNGFRASLIETCWRTGGIESGTASVVLLNGRHWFEASTGKAESMFSRRDSPVC